MDKYDTSNIHAIIFNSIETSEWVGLKPHQILSGNLCKPDDKWYVSKIYIDNNKMINYVSWRLLGNIKTKCDTTFCLGHRYGLLGGFFGCGYINTLDVSSTGLTNSTDCDGPCYVAGCMSTGKNKKGSFYKILDEVLNGMCVNNIMVEDKVLFKKSSTIGWCDFKSPIFPSELGITQHTVLSYIDNLT